MLATLIIATILAPKTITKTADLAGVWEGLSLCADKTEFPSVKDEQVVYHIAVKNEKVVFIDANKIVDGKEEPMSDKPMELTFDASSCTLKMQVVGRKSTDWTFSLSWSTWVGVAKETDSGKVMRNILVKRR